MKIEFVDSPKDKERMEVPNDHVHVSIPNYHVNKVGNQLYKAIYEGFI